MITEKSCGAIVCTKESGDIEYVIIRSLQSRMIYPAGMISASQMIYASRMKERILYHIALAIYQ